jgi:hypothetical protein
MNDENTQAFEFKRNLFPKLDRNTVSALIILTALAAGMVSYAAAASRPPRTVTAYVTNTQSFTETSVSTATAIVTTTISTSYAAYTQQQECQTYACQFPQQNWPNCVYQYQQYCNYPPNAPENYFEITMVISSEGKGTGCVYATGTNGDLFSLQNLPSNYPTDTPVTVWGYTLGNEAFNPVTGHSCYGMAFRVASLH